MKIPSKVLLAGVSVLMFGCDEAAVIPPPADDTGPSVRLWTVVGFSANSMNPEVTSILFQREGNLAACHYNGGEMLSCSDIPIPQAFARP